MLSIYPFMVRENFNGKSIKNQTIVYLDMEIGNSSGYHGRFFKNSPDESGVAGQSKLAGIIYL